MLKYELYLNFCENVQQLIELLEQEVACIKARDFKDFSKLLHKKVELLTENLTLTDKVTELEYFNQLKTDEKQNIKNLTQYLTKLIQNVLNVVENASMVNKYFMHRKTQRNAPKSTSYSANGYLYKTTFINNICKSM